MSDRLEEMIRGPWNFTPEDISVALDAVVAERDALAAALTTMGVDPASIIAAMAKP